MVKFIKVVSTVVNAEDIESISPSTFTDHNGLTFPRVVIRLRNGNLHKFNLKSDTEVQLMVDGIFKQLAQLDECT